jgi:uncharacterized protein (TIGR02996 family)
VPDLARLLLRREAVTEEDWYGLRELQATLSREPLAVPPEERGFVAAIREAPAEEANWQVYSDWLEENNQPAVNSRLLEATLRRLKLTGGSDPVRNRVRVGNHVVQALLHLDGEDRFDQWILFDDVWASAQPALAAAILRYATAWDVLSTGSETRWE